jgi:hypothetical protein
MDGIRLRAGAGREVSAENGEALAVATGERLGEAGSA